MTRIEDIIAAEQKRVETILRAAYDAGKADAKREMLSVLSGDTTSSSGMPQKELGVEGRKRAPRGLPRKFVTRVLFDNHIIGSTPQDIVDAAISEHEKMIPISTVRSELRNGIADGRYEEANGYWSLSDDEYHAYEDKDPSELTSDMI